MDGNGVKSDAGNPARAPRGLQPAYHFSVVLVFRLSCVRSVKKLEGGAVYVTFGVLDCECVCSVVTVSVRSVGPLRQRVCMCVYRAPR